MHPIIPFFAILRKKEKEKEMPVIEKNDTDISKLFHWSDKFIITDRYGNEVVTAYIRLIGDAELNRARVQAIRASKELRTKLKTEGTDERIVFIPEIEDITREQLIELILIQKVREFSQDAMKEVSIPVPVEPHSESDLEKQEKYQTEIDNYESVRVDKIKQITTNKVENYRGTLNGRTDIELGREYEKLVINDLCEQEMIKKFRELCVYFGSFSDEEHTKYLFDNFNQFDNLPTEVKQQFLDSYQQLEISIDFLKRSLEVTPSEPVGK